MSAQICPGCGSELTGDVRFCPKCGRDVATRICQSCGAQLLEGARFCQKCGREVSVRVCQNCGAQLLEGARFCRNCGKEIISTLPLEKKPPLTKVSPNKKPKMRWQYRLAIALATVVFLGIVIPILIGRQNQTPSVPAPPFQDMVRLLTSKVDIPEDSRVYGVLDPFPGGADISIQPDVGDVITFRASQPTYFFFIDDEPLMRFAHPVRYVLLEASGQAHVYPNEWLPVVNGQNWKVHEQIEVQGVPVTVLMESGKVQGLSPTGSTLPRDLVTFAVEHLLPYQEALAQSGSGKIAVILDGSEVKEDYREEVAQQFADDADNTELILSLQGYDTKRYSGYDGNIAPSIDSAGLEKEITRIAEETRPGDEVTVYLGGHGNIDCFLMHTKEGESSLIFYEDMATWMRKIDPGVKIRLIIDACESGGAKPHFADMPNVIVYTATDENSPTPIGLGKDMSWSKYFREGFNSEAADQNRDGEQDIDECCRYASQQNKMTHVLVEKEEEGETEEQSGAAGEVVISFSHSTVDLDNPLLMLRAHVNHEVIGPSDPRYILDWYVGDAWVSSWATLQEGPFLSAIGNQEGTYIVTLFVYDSTGNFVGKDTATVTTTTTTTTETMTPANAYRTYRGTLTMTMKSLQEDLYGAILTNCTITIPFEELPLYRIQDTDMFAYQISTPSKFTGDWSLSLKQPSSAGVTYSASPTSGQFSGDFEGRVWGVLDNGELSFSASGFNPQRELSPYYTLTQNYTGDPPYVVQNIVYIDHLFDYADKIWHIVTLGGVDTNTITHDWPTWCSLISQKSQIRTSTPEKTSQNIKFSGSYVNYAGATITYDGNLALDLTGK